MVDEERIRELEESDAWDDSDERVELEVSATLDKVIPIRISSETWRELRALARDQRVGPSTLARAWIEQRLAEERKPARGSRPAVAVAAKSELPVDTANLFSEPRS